ncbi:serine hydrolase [Chryseobacterium sp. BIGb0232]|uniref:serine hydrolase domain-containing protein n=1 Tax=Chryseobacterium sp. BIGb0232 TaxID=2940598 RepID=UPI000FAAC0E9|nr:serine hydrolase domain-containing protein [Chryseobacterium sp. BIGb0232]MCS4303293.1 CubicO group peptidase (beta-lactamase class C family) [Chryseobacterium sp. BIGb0232]ROS11433.1 CubicO group peptidase (beta-lactamase class C family) [Chryseobacterium nakagawai]
MFLIYSDKTPTFTKQNQLPQKTNMLYPKKISLFFTALLLLTNSVFAQTKKITQIDSLMNSVNQSGVFNGTVLVSKNNKIIYNAAFGFADAAKTEKLTPDYRFNIGSITKEFSGVALLQLQEQGKLKIEDHVSQYIPELPQWAHEVTIKDLLQYTSGLPNVNWKKIKSNQDVFDDLKLIDKLDFIPGTQYDYNMNNVFLRQFIVEKITGMTYKNYVSQNIFKPCTMNSSEITPIVDKKLVAKGFNNKSIEDKPDFLVGGTFLTTTDLLKFVNCLHSKKLINENSLFELGQQFNLPDTQSSLGEAKFKNKKLVEHSHDGRAGNYEALLVSDLNDNFTIILLGNNYNGKLFEISDVITAILKKGNK